MDSEERRSEKKTETVKYPNMPFSAACFAPGFSPAPADVGCCRPPGAANSPSLFPAGEEENSSLYISKILVLISRRM